MLNDRARELRKNSTNAEKLIWNHLRNRQLNRFKFNRQYIIEPYIVDFICREKKLIIELDGSQHAEQIEYDNERTNFLESKGHKVLRFWNNEVMTNHINVLEVILDELIGPQDPHPSPLPQAVEGIGSL